MIGSIGHVRESRLGRVALQEGPPLTDGERHHLDGCASCGQLLAGHRLAMTVLSGPWATLDAASGFNDSGVLTIPPTRVLRRQSGGDSHRLVLPAVAAIGLVLLGAVGALLATGRPVPDDLLRPTEAVPSTAPLIPPPATIRPGSPAVQSGMVVRVDAATGDIVDTVTLGGEPGILSEADGNVWVFNFFRGTVTRLDPADGRVMDTLEFGDGASAILGDGADLWVTAGRSLFRLDARTGSQSARFDLAEQPLFRTGDAGFLAVAGGSVWVTVPDLSRPFDPHELWRVDPSTGAVQERLTIDRDPQPPVTLGDAIYAVSPTRNTLTRVGATTNDVTSVRVAAEPSSVAAGDGSVWVGHWRGMLIWRVNPDTLLREATIDVGEPIRGLAYGGGRLWATTWTSLHAIDPATNRVVGTTRLMKVPVPRGPAGVLPLGDAIWVGVESP